jgi:hypothetical protein
MVSIIINQRPPVDFPWTSSLLCFHHVQHRQAKYIQSSEQTSLIFSRRYIYYSLWVLLTTPFVPVWWGVIILSQARISSDKCWGTQGVTSTCSRSRRSGTAKCTGRLHMPAWCQIIGSIQIATVADLHHRRIDKIRKRETAHRTHDVGRWKTEGFGRLVLVIEPLPFCQVVVIEQEPTMH